MLMRVLVMFMPMLVLASLGHFFFFGGHRGFWLADNDNLFFRV